MTDQSDDTGRGDGTPAPDGDHRASGESQTGSNEEGQPLDGELDLTRRGLLSGVAAIGVVGSLTGVGTQMALSDRNRFEENRLESGSLELGLAWEERYNGTTQEDEGVCGSDTWDAYHDVSEAIVELDAVEPGDSGTLDVCLRLSANVDSTWMRLLVHSVAENGVNSTEEQAGDVTPDVGELQKHLEVTVQTESDCETARETSPRIEGDLAQMGAGPLGTGIQLAETTRCVIIEWQLPEDVPATILTDSVEFAIDFAAVQSRPDDSQSPWANSNS